MSFDLRDALDQVVPPGPAATTRQKRQYSDDLSRVFSAALAESMQSHFPMTTAGTGTGIPAVSAAGLKSIDVAFNILGIGLGVGLSVKCVGLPEGQRGYSHNYKRVHEEWTAETVVYHRYQPQAIIVGLIFLPIDSLWDRPRITSLPAALDHFRPFAGRSSVQTDHELMERIYIGVYSTHAPVRGLVRFVDATCVVTGRAIPDAANFQTFEDVKAALLDEFRRRNRRLRIQGLPL